ncbi:MAG: hypothetical protein LBI88_04885 [Deltaproteobacteria bacterium]|jgi:hypothetical protein|nr:hypothetical protein [Deltaproteobacteria bacterium]
MIASVPALPSWLAACLVSDSELARAYEATAPELLAVCKHTLAVHHVFFGEAPDWEEQSVLRCVHGFRTRACSRPADWALVIFAADYASAPRLLAATMPALLARVPLVLCVCTPGPARPELLCALELAGQEQIYVLELSQSLDLVRGLAAQPGQGRLVLLHRGALSVLRVAADEAELPCWEERRAPVLRICGAEPDAELIHLAHPDAASAEQAAPDAVYCSWPDAGQEQAPLVFPPGMEGCWLHPSLTPDFFRTRALLFGPVPDHPDTRDLP